MVIEIIKNNIIKKIISEYELTWGHFLQNENIQSRHFGDSSPWLVKVQSVQSDSKSHSALETLMKWFHWGMSMLLALWIFQRGM